MRKVFKMFCSVAIMSLAVIGLTSCDSDKDDNGIDDRVESEGVYRIDVDGYENVRNEYIEIVKVSDESSAKIKGSIYAANVDETYYFYSQDVTIREFEGNIWYATVDCTDGARRRIYFRRTGIGDYVSTGGVSLGFSGAEAGINWTTTTYNEYGRITYCIYSSYTYVK